MKTRFLVFTLIVPAAILVSLPPVAQAQANINGVLYVGGSITQWGTGDIGSQIMNAYNALPITGGTISVIPKADGSCYQFSTQIAFTTANKYVILQGLAPSTANNNNPGGACLWFTTTGVSAAVVIDWTPGCQTCGGGYANAAGLRDITLVNTDPSHTSAPCATQGGCGSQALGIQIGGTNGGMHEGSFSNVKVEGFQNGYHIADGGLGWGVTWLHCTTVWNTVGIFYSSQSPHELDQYISGAINANWVGVQLNAWGAELAIIGTSLDANRDSQDGSGCAVTMGDGAILHLSNVHFENNVGATNQTPCFVYGTTASSKVDITGGVAQDDAGTGTESSSWFTAGWISANGLIVYSHGRTTNVPLFTGNSLKQINVLDTTPSQLPNL